jgi:hypothetical protein
VLQAPKSEHFAGKSIPVGMREESGLHFSQAGSFSF